MAIQTGNTGIISEYDATYKAKVKDLASQYNLLCSELARLQSETVGSANTLDTLGKKVELLGKAHQTMSERLELYTEKLNNAQSLYEDYSQKVADAQEKIDELTRKQEELGSITEDNAEDHRRLNQELQEYQEKLRLAEEGQQRTSESVRQWETQMNNAQTGVNRLAGELSQNNKYLEEAQANASRTAQSIDKFGNRVQDSADATGRTKKAVEELSKVLTESGVSATAGKINDALLECVDSAGKFETAVAGVGAIADTKALPLQNMKEQIIELSNELGVSASDIAESAYNAISSSVDTADAVGFVEQATKLATSGFTDTTTAIGVLSTAINSYGLETSQASQMSDYLITAQNLTKTSVAELAAGMENIIPVAANYNVGMENLTSAYVTLSENGATTAESTTYLESLFRELGDSGSIVSKTLRESTGMSFESLMKQGESLGDVIEILSESVDGDTDAFNELWGSSEAGIGALSLLSSGAEKYNGVLAQMEQSTGATDTAFEDMTDTVEYAKQKMENSFENMKIAIGDQLTPVIKNLSEAGAEAFGWATDFINDHPEIVTAVTAVAVGLGGMVTAVTAVSTATSIASTIWESFTTLVAAHPLVAVATGVAAVVTAIGAFIAITGSAKEEEDTLQKKTQDLKTSMDETIQTYDAAKEQVQQNADAQKGLAAELSELIGQEEKTAETKSRISELVNLLNEEVPNLALAYDQQTDSLNMTIEAIDELLEREEREQEYNVAVEERTELLKERAEASEILREAEEELTAATEAQNAAQEQNGEWTALTGGEYTQLQCAVTSAKVAYDEAKASLEELDLKLRDSGEIITEHQLSVAGMSESVLAERDALLESASAFGENSLECQAAQEAIAALDEAYLTHTGELQLRVEEIQSQQDALRQEYDATSQSIYNTLSSEMGLFEEVSIKGYDSVETMIGAMDSQISFMDTYAANIQKAMELGVDEGIVKTLSDGSVDSAKILQAIVDDGGTHIDEFNEKFKKVEDGKKTFSDNLAEIQLEFNEKMQDLEDQLASTIEEMNQADDAYEAGMQTVTGFINGSESMRQKIIDTYNSLSDAAIATAKKKLDQHSPSRKFREIGQYNVIGAIQGTEAERPRLVQAYANTASAAIEAYNTRAAALMENMRAKQYAEFISVPAAMRDDREMRLPETSADPAALQVLERLAEAMENRKNRSGITQNVTIVNPEGTPAANARALRKVERGLAFGL